jgi:hypothetical protein
LLPNVEDRGFRFRRSTSGWRRSAARSDMAPVRGNRAVMQVRKHIFGGALLRQRRTLRLGTLLPINAIQRLEYFRGW